MVGDSDGMQQDTACQLYIKGRYLAATDHLSCQKLPLTRLQPPNFPNCHFVFTTFNNLLNSSHANSVATSARLSKRAGGERWKVVVCKQFASV